MYKLELKKLEVKKQCPLPVIYKGKKLECNFRLDLIVENEVVIEIKSVGQLAPIHEAQLLTYLKLRGGGRGLLINFNVPVLKNGIKRVIV